MMDDEVEFCAGCGLPIEACCCPEPQHGEIRSSCKRLNDSYLVRYTMFIDPRRVFV